MIAKRKKEDQADLELCRVRVVHPDRVAKAGREGLAGGESRAMTAIFKAMGDATRLKMLHALSHGEMCVCDLAAFAKVSESAISHQLRRLKDLGLVKPRREGQILYYSLDDDHVHKLIGMCLEHVRHR